MIKLIVGAGLLVLLLLLGCFLLRDPYYPLSGQGVTKIYHFTESNLCSLASMLMVDSEVYDLQRHRASTSTGQAIPMEPDRRKEYTRLMRACGLSQVRRADDGSQLLFPYSCEENSCGTFVKGLAYIETPPTNLTTGIDFYFPKHPDEAFILEPITGSWYIFMKRKK